MKKYLIILVVLALLAPAAAHAFSLLDALNFGKRLIHLPAQPAPAEIKNVNAAQAAQFSTLSAETKLNNWQTAFDEKNIDLALADDRNLYFTDTEINYLIARELASTTNPIARNVIVSFSDNLIKISGNLTIKNLSGDFYLEARPLTANDRLSLRVTKARFHNFYFPSFIAQAILSGQLRTAIDFLYSDPLNQKLSLTLGNGFIQLNYENQ
ncbi:MAG TPA: hypothetical protein VMC41_01400 [Candidatus Nanoarchaeia archaeon]|nr:hypothetical protein [Candidatus Nanoarchaeia archaeon]